MSDVIGPYWGIIEFATAVLLILYFGNLGHKLLKVRVDARVKQAKIAEQNKTFQGVSSVVENHEEILNQLFNLRKEQLQQMDKQGLSQDKIALALKPLDQRIKYVEMVKSNAWWLQYVAPQADRLIGIGLQAVERILKSV